MLLFVYGSLRKGMYNHEYVGMHKEKLVATVRTKPKYELVSLGNYPLMCAGSDSVVGEIYDLDPDGECAQRISRMELGAGYKLEEIHLEPGAGVAGPVYGWLRPLEKSRRASWEKRVPSGDWVLHKSGVKN